MLKKLRLKIILAIVLVAAVMLCAILGLFYTLTKQNLRTQSISMMQAIAADPFAPVQPEREPQQVRLPYFVLQTDAFGNLVAIGSSDYDLTDRTFLRMVAAAAQASRDAIGEIPEYSLRYCRVTGSVIFADISSEQQTLRTLLKTGALLVALGLLAFFGLAVLLARSAVRPVEEAWRQQKQFVADASHELRTPMAVIMAQCEDALSGEKTGADYREALSVIHRQGWRMNRMISGMLELVRLERKTDRYAREPFNLSALTESVCEDMALICEKNIALTTDVEPDISITGDQTLITRLLGNLIGNAYRYGRENGHIIVTLHRAGSAIELTVSDDGIGIAPDQQKKIFRRLYQGASERSGDGAGLGLAMARQIARLHGGELTVVSEEGNGSAFTARFPMQ